MPCRYGIVFSTTGSIHSMCRHGFVYCTMSRSDLPERLHAHELLRLFGEGARCAARGVERPASTLPGHGMWGCTRPVSRPHGAVSDRRKGSGHKLFVHGRLRRQGILLGERSNTIGGGAYQWNLKGHKVDMACLIWRVYSLELKAQ